MERVREQHRKSQSLTEATAATGVALEDGAVSVAMIQALIPLGLHAVNHALQQEVTELAGARYARGDGTTRLFESRSTGASSWRLWKSTARSIAKPRVAR